MFNVPQGTIASRANALAKRGLIQLRGRGGHKPMPPRPPGTSDHPLAPTRAAPAMTFVAVAEVQEILSTLKRLEARIEAVEHVALDPPAPTRAAPRVPAPTREGVQQWTIRLSKTLIERLKAEAARERLQPSHLVEAILSEWCDGRHRASSGNG